MAIRFQFMIFKVFQHHNLPMALLQLNILLLKTSNLHRIIPCTATSEILKSSTMDLPSKWLLHPPSSHHLLCIRTFQLNISSIQPIILYISRMGRFCATLRNPLILHHFWSPTNPFYRHFCEHISTQFLMNQIPPTSAQSPHSAPSLVSDQPILPPLFL